MEISIEKGRGYVPAEENRKPNAPFGTIYTDSIYTPVKNVKYAIECYNKGTDKNKFGKFEYFNRVVTNYLSLNNYN